MNDLFMQIDVSILMQKFSERRCISFGMKCHVPIQSVKHPIQLPLFLCTFVKALKHNNCTFVKALKHNTCTFVKVLKHNTCTFINHVQR